MNKPTKQREINSGVTSILISRQESLLTLAVQKGETFRTLLVPLCVAAIWILATVTWGDIAPYPHPRPSEPVLDTSRTFISMQHAGVDINLKKQSTTQIVATVNCQFEITCLQAKTPSTDFMMALPVGYDSAGQVPDFHMVGLKVDGKPRQDFRKERWIEPRVHRGIVSYQGFVWPITVNRGAKHKVSVSYEMLLPVGDNKSSFTYILRSGGNWHGPIGHEAVHIKGDTGLELYPEGKPTLHPVRKDDGSIVWEIKNVVPTEDVSVRIHTTPASK